MLWHDGREYVTRLRALAASLATKENDRRGQRDAALSNMVDIRNRVSGGRGRRRRTLQTPVTRKYQALYMVRRSGDTCTLAL